MKKLFIPLLGMAMSIGFVQAQNDTMYIMESGNVVYQWAINEIDSIIFYKPVTNPELNIATVNIPAGTFTMGSPKGEVNHESNETQYQVTLSTFEMSKYEITNAQFAAFLNVNSIGSNGLYSAGAYPDKALIYESTDGSNFGLHYTSGQWVTAAGYENHPVIKVTWYGATEFASYVDGRLPTEAEWEYACRAETVTPFNTGSCLTDTQANYNWAYPYDTCKNTNIASTDTTRAVGTYAANMYGLHDMHGNVSEWCSDWLDTYPATPKTNPTGAATGSIRVCRGGSWDHRARYCRSAFRGGYYPINGYLTVGFRVVIVP